ncbi:MAG: protein kinase [Myxococcota bacterium]
MTDDPGSQAAILDWFDQLCDLSDASLKQRIAEVPEDLRPRVEAMLASDRSGRSLDVSIVQWALAVDVVADGAPPERELPEQIGPYRRLYPLGQGGMGRVFVAEQESPRRRVALKVLHSGRTAVSEAQALADVRDVHIPHVIEVGQHGDLAWLAMELVHGDALDAWARGRGLDERVAVLARIARGVAAAHAAGVLHRDLKPANVVVEPSGVPRIVDFGLAGDTDSELVLAGTLAYLSPERLDGEAASERSDVFALGVTAFEVLCGERPWPRASHPSLSAERIVRSRTLALPTTSGLGADLEAIVRMALSPGADRYPSAAALADDLEAWLAHRPLQAYPLGPAGRARLWARRQRGLLVAMGATAALVGASAVGVLGGLWGHGVWVRGENERIAEERLDALLPTLAQRLEAGERDRATEVLESFVADASVRDTPAVAEAWLAHHEQLLAAGDVAGAREMLARAYLAAGEAQRRPVRRAMARLLARERDWERLLETLEGDADPEVRPLRAAALVALRRFDTPGATVSPVLEGPFAALRSAHRTPFRPLWIEPLPPEAGGGAVLVAQDEGRVVWVDTVPGLPERRSVALPPMSFGFNHPLLAAGDEPVLVGFPAGERGALQAWSLGEDLSPLGEVSDETAFLGDATFADVDGDGVRELYTGSQYPTRALTRSDRGEDGWEARNALSGDGSIGADLRQVLAVDLDRDGDDELVVATGLWEGDDLRVYDGGPDGLVLKQRFRFQGGPDAALTTGPDGARWLIVGVSAVEDLYANGPASPSRLAPGLHGFRVGDDGTLVHALEVPPPPGPFVVAGIHPGDFDGDGRVEIAAHVNANGPYLWLVGLSAGTDGTVAGEGMLVHGAEPFAVVDVDGDGSDELLARLWDDDHHLWVLGQGDAALPVVAEARKDDVATGARAILDLVRFGFELETAGALSSQAEAMATDRAAAADFALAAALWVRQRRPGDAVRMYDRALSLRDDPEWRVLRASAAAQAHRDGPPDWRVAGDEVSGALEWRRPAVLSADPDGLRIDAIGADGLLAELPLDPTDSGEVGLDVGVTVEQLEPGVIVSFELVDRSGEPIQTLALEAWGGNLRVGQISHCSDRGLRERARRYTALERERHAALHRLFVHRGLREGAAETVCELTPGGGAASTFVRATSAEDAPAALRIRIDAEPQVAAGHAKVTVHDLSVWGGTARPVEDPPWIRAWAASRLQEARAAAPDAVARVELDVALGEWDAALAGLRALDLEEPEVRAMVLRGLKRDPGPWIPLVRARTPEGFGALYAEVWAESLASQRTEAVRATVSHPFVDDLEPTTPEVRSLLLQRALLLASEGQTARARRLYERLLPGADGDTAVRARIELAVVMHDGGKSEIARRLCQEAEALDHRLRVQDAALDRPAVAEACGR